MKRHPALVPLSSEHHQGLVWSRKLLDLDDSLTEEEIHSIFDEFKGVWNDEINPHFRKEEEILLPLFERTGHATENPVMEMLRQHIVIRARMFALRDEGALQYGMQVGELLKAHIRFEERELFPFIEQHSDEDLLKRLGEALE